MKTLTYKKTIVILSVLFVLFVQNVQANEESKYMEYFDSEKIYNPTIIISTVGLFDVFGSSGYPAVETTDAKPLLGDDLCSFIHECDIFELDSVDSEKGDLEKLQALANYYPAGNNKNDELIKENENLKKIIGDHGLHTLIKELKYKLTLMDLMLENMELKEELLEANESIANLELAIEEYELKLYE